MYGDREPSSPVPSRAPAFFPTSISASVSLGKNTGGERASHHLTTEIANRVSFVESIVTDAGMRYFIGPNLLEDRKKRAEEIESGSSGSLR